MRLLTEPNKTVNIFIIFYDKKDGKIYFHLLEKIAKKYVNVILSK